MIKDLRLADLLYKMDEHTTIWVAENEDAEVIYWNEAGLIEFKTACSYNVKTFYPEYYPAIHTTGITIIVEGEK